MSMRIRTNVTSLISQRHLTNNSKQLSESMEKLASGFRINRSKDDSAGLAIAESMRGKIRGFNQAKRNANDAISMLQVAEGGMAEISNLLIRMRELTVQAATDTIGDSDRSYLNKEYTQLASEIDRIAATTEFNGNKFFVENPKGVTEYVIQVGANNSSEEENIDTLKINLEGLKFTAADFGIGKEAEIGPLSAAESGPSRADIASRLTVLDEGVQKIAERRAGLGAIQSRLDSTVNSLSINVENLDTARSRIIDVDYATETAELAKSRIIVNSNLSIQSQANQMPEMALALLK